MYGIRIYNIIYIHISYMYMHTCVLELWRDMHEPVWTLERAHLLGQRPIFASPSFCRVCNIWCGKRLLAPASCKEMLSCHLQLKGSTSGTLSVKKREVETGSMGSAIYTTEDAWLCTSCPRTSRTWRNSLHWFDVLLILHHQHLLLLPGIATWCKWILNHAKRAKRI